MLTRRWRYRVCDANHPGAQNHVTNGLTRVRNRQHRSQLTVDALVPDVVVDAEREADEPPQTPSALLTDYWRWGVQRSVLGVHWRAVDRSCRLDLVAAGIDRWYTIDIRGRLVGQSADGRRRVVGHVAVGAWRPLPP